MLMRVVCRPIYHMPNFQDYRWVPGASWRRRHPRRALVVDLRHVSRLGRWQVALGVLSDRQRWSPFLW
jgi:hypothetical protein